MDIISASWDKRNLGVDVYEIRLNKIDLLNLSEVINLISSGKFKNSYLTIKIPVSNLDALHALEAIGFQFMETQFHMGKSLNHYETPKLLSRVIVPLKQQEIVKNEDSWRAITNLMTDNMFHTDRIYLDPKLTSGISCKRYKNWIIDSVKDQDSHLFVYYYKDNPIGISFIKIDKYKKIVYDLLEGIFEKYQNSGLGFSVFDCALKSYQGIGIKKLKTSISSNNPSILKLDLVFGYIIEDEEYVLRKFN